jgi:hypothetical protein
MRRLVILNVLLLAIVVALVVQIFALWWRAEANVEPSTPRESKTQRLEVPPAVRRPPPPDVATRIADKDLFDASRSADKTVAAAPVDAPPPQPLTLSLLGVTVAGTGREALFRDSTVGKSLWLREGEEFNGHKINRIDPTSVLLVTPTGDQVTLMINVEKRGGGAVTGPAGIVPTPTPIPNAAGQRPPRITPPRVLNTPAPDIREKIERLREEARKRRNRPSQPQQ